MFIDIVGTYLITQTNQLIVLGNDLTRTCNNKRQDLAYPCKIQGKLGR